MVVSAAMVDGDNNGGVELVEMVSAWGLWCGCRRLKVVAGGEDDVEWDMTSGVMLVVAGERSGCRVLRLGSAREVGRNPYVQSLEKEVDELESEKAEFSNEYDLLLQECVSKDIMHSILRALANIYEQTELQCLYLKKIEECECLASELSKRNENVEYKSFNELLKNDLKAQLKDKTIANAEMRQSWNKMKGKGVDTNFGIPSILGKPPLQPITNQPVVRQPTAFKS
ncbi:hypothetical protein Tco_0424497 [Tanacetum coccineum]